MANELPYFRFTVQAWQNGKISIEDYSLKGLFIDVCGFYWVQDCSIDIAMLEKKFRDSKDKINELFELDILKKDGKMVSILFLDEQFDLLSTKRKLRQEAGSKGGTAKSKALLQQNPSNATPMQEQNPSYKDKDKDKDNTAPSFEAFEIYCKDNGFATIAKKAFDWYEGNKWMVGKRKIVNWKNQLRTNWFDDKNKDKNESEKLIRCIRKDHMGRCDVEITMAKIEQLRNNGTYVEIL